MAIISHLTSKTQGQNRNSGQAMTGVKAADIQNTVSVGATDSATSTYLLFQDVPYNAKLKDFFIENDNLGAGALFSIGLADPKTGVAVAAACLASGLVGSAIHKKGFDGTAANLALDGLAALTHEQTELCLWEVAQLANAAETNAVAQARGRYDVIITYGTAGGSAGKITGRAKVKPAG